jgi:tetratricopeptide (TPR) repeat protein
MSLVTRTSSSWQKLLPAVALAASLHARVAEAPAAPTPAKERTLAPGLQQKLNIALELARKEQCREALQAYGDLIQSPLSTQEERWRWYVRTGALHLQSLQWHHADRVFRRVIDPKEGDSAREVSLVVGGETRVVKVADPLSPSPPPGALQDPRHEHDKYEACLGMARVSAASGQHERAGEWVEKADSAHPAACPLCDSTAPAMREALIQVYLAASQQTPSVDVAFNRLHALLEGSGWIPPYANVSPAETQQLLAAEARLTLGEILLTLNDAPKAKTFFADAAKGDSPAARLARAHLRKLTDVKQRPSERNQPVQPAATPAPGASTEPMRSTPTPPG